MSIHQESSTLSNLINLYNKCLADISAIPFTWYNKRTNTKAIFERLDRTLSSYQWLQLYPIAIENLPF